MKSERLDYQAVLESLADGAEVDWAALETIAATAGERRRYHNLRIVARVAELHRTLVVDDDAPAAGPAGADTHVLVVPGAWGHLEVQERIAGGAFGDVYLARDPHLNRDVALKLLRLDASTGLPERLLDEARTLARVRHPNVVTVHGADVRDGRAGLWMEFVHGRTLESWLQAHGALGPGEATTLGVDLCRALAAVHGAGLVHGDVKAQNVMREEGGRTVLMDFGAGRVQGARAASLAGTPLYLAPEVLAGEPATPRSDIYSLGVLLFHLLTRAYPYSAADLDGLRAAHADGSRVMLRDLRPDLPDALVQAVHRALEPDPARRFATAGEMEQGLAQALQPPPVRRPSVWLIAASLTAAAAIALLVAIPALLPVSTTPVRSIAILPFAVSGGLPDQQHLVVGLTTDVVRELQKFDVEVKRASTGRPNATGTDIEQRLDADSTVRGELRRSPTRTAVHIEVHRAGSGTLLSKEYEVFDAALPLLARRIAEDVANVVHALERAGAALTRPTKFAAYDAYQRGRALWEQRTEGSAKRSLEYFQQAAKLDPAYAAPWAGMADVYITQGVAAFGPLLPLEARRLAKEAATRALELDPNLVEAHTSLAFAAFFHDWDWDRAETLFKKAIGLNEQYALAHHWYANHLNAMGRQDEAMAEIKRAQELEPLSIIIDRDIAWHLFFQEKYDEAITHLQQTLGRDSTYAAAHTLLARALAERGRFEEAVEHLRLATSGTKQASGVNLSFVAYVQARSGDTRAADATLAQVEKLREVEYVPPYYDALVYTAQGRPRKALDALERAYREQDSTLVSLMIDPRFEPLRDEPRYQDLVKRMRFPERPR
jgi:tetratricopeptide (TPR) repeat protein/predicted Ser/Thr protein kinase